MKLHLNRPTEQNTFTAYGTDFVRVGQIQHRQSILVSAQAVMPWSAHTFADLEIAHFTPLIALKPAVVLLGTGSTLRFPHPRLTATLLQAGIGVEVMDIAAACRTFNFLLAEGREVVAAILLETSALS